MALAATLKGISTLTWGTDNLANIPTSAIIESGKITPKNGEPIEIEDNNGFAAAVVFLDDGFDAQLTFVHDTAKSWPNIADRVSMTMPKWGGNGTSTFNCFVAATPEVDMARKREATISYKIRYRPGMNMTAW